MSERRIGRPREHQELGRWVEEGWQSVGEGSGWRQVEGWFHEDRQRAEVWKAHVEFLGYDAVRQFVIDHCPFKGAYPYPIHPVEAIAVVARGALVVRASEVVYRWPQGSADQAPAFGALQAITNAEPSATLNYRAGTIVCEVANPDASKASLQAFFATGNPTS